MQSGITKGIWAVGIIWAVYLLDIIMPFDINAYGIHPREIGGLVGVFTSPFLHANLPHIISNSIPLFLLTAALAVFYKRIWLPVIILSALLGGISVWLIARGGTNHIGASGVIFSLMAFLILSGVFRRTFKALIVGVVVFFLYGGSMVFGVLPLTPGVSWEGHLFGAIAGGILAWIYRRSDTEQTQSANTIS